MRPSREVRPPPRRLPDQVGFRRRPLRIMVIDDSITARTVLARIIESESDLLVTAQSHSAEAALNQLEHIRVDVILLDLQMPGIGGIAALPRIIAKGRGAKVMIVSSLTEEGAEQTLRALALGATDTLLKPTAGKFDTRFAKDLTGKIRALGSSAPPHLAASANANAMAMPLALRALTSNEKCQAAAVAIGASTGGIYALGELLKAVPRHIGIPILVTQHLPASFMPAFARQLLQLSGFETMVAEDGMAVRPGKILIAPGHAHLTVEGAAGQMFVRLDTTPAASHCLPSVDPMFASLAATLGDQALGVVLTGMGRDGLIGSRHIVEAGGTVFAQDEATSAVWGMPKAVVLAGLASAILPPTRLGERIGANANGLPWT